MSLGSEIGAALGNAATGGIPAAISSVSDLVSAILDRTVPDPIKRQALQAQAEQAIRTNDLETFKVSMSAITVEAASADKWTSRARPAFLYLMYGIIIWCFVAGMAWVAWPAQADAAAIGVQHMLAAIPGDLWWLFGAGYLGYTGSRSFDKWKRGAK